MKAQSQEAYLLYFLEYEGILSVLTGIALSRRFLKVHTNTLFNTKKKICSNYLKSATIRFFQGTSTRINEPPVFEPLKFYCTCIELPVGECIEHKS